MTDRAYPPLSPVATGLGLPLPALRQGPAVRRASSTCGRAARPAGSTTRSPIPATGRRCSSCFSPAPSWSAAALGVEIAFEPPFWVHALLWLPLILATTLLPLRPMKGLMIALQYHHRAAEGRVDGGTG